jgi:large subunit ribosomal protein L18
MLTKKVKDKEKSLNRRHLRIRKKVRGVPEKPRLTVYKSLGQIYAQLVDDVSQKTITGASSLTEEVRKSFSDKETKISMAKKVGNYLAKKALEMGIKKVVFDRNIYPYHGRIKALAEGAREGGLEF